jgi:glycosidase
MSSPTSISDLDLTPLAGKIYFSIDREWREEFIYFLMVDRFHDDIPRTPVKQAGRSPGKQVPDNAFYGGKIRGITQNLDYLGGLGCTAIWLSPVFVNNPGAYHGYNINNYLDIDPNFGTKEDLIELVDAAHNFKKDGKPFPIRIILDVVINHSGDNWEYKGGPKNYSNDTKFDFDQFRPNRSPIPVELRNAELYHRRGNISHFDAFPENQHGDISGLKDYENDDDELGSQLINILIMAHCYWIREADVDGFRVDAVKHMGELACSRFSSGIREYAYSLGKRHFFLFGEVATPDDSILDRYIGQNTSRLDGDDTVFFGLDSVLDFRLAEGKFADPNNQQLRNVLKGHAGPETLFNRLEAQRSRALNRGEIGRYLVTFVDNHDSFWQPSGRFGVDALPEQIIGGIGYLICTLGTPCLYYGTEQGFVGIGGDNNMREAMFDKDPPGRNLLNTECTIYREIARIAEVMRATEHLRFGRMYYRQISGNDTDFGFPFGTAYTLAFSRVLYGSEVLVAYNISETSRNDAVLVDASAHKTGDTMKFLYPAPGAVTVQEAPNGTRFVKLPLAGHEFVILK